MSSQSEPIKYRIVASGHPEKPRIEVIVEQKKVASGLLSLYIEEGYPSIDMQEV